MPGDTPMSYPFPYKTGDGNLQGQSGLADFTNVDVTGDVTSNQVFSNEVTTDNLIIRQGGVPVFNVTSGSGPSRGIIRTLDDAFGCDISVQGTSKTIRLLTDDIERVRVADTQTLLSTNLISTAVIQGLQLVSTATTGTAPFSVASNTVVPNLNVSQLLGSTWAVPPAIGSTTPNAGTFTTATIGTIIGNNTVVSTRDGLSFGTGGNLNMYLDRNVAGGVFIFGANTSRLTTETQRFTIYNNGTDQTLMFTAISKGSSSGTDRVVVGAPLYVTTTGTPQTINYPLATGACSTKWQTSSAGTTALEMGIASAASQFGTSTLAGDGVIKVTSGGRILMQVGNGAANLIMSPTDVTFNGTSLIGGGGTTFGTYTPVINITSGPAFGGGYTSTNVGTYVKTGRMVTVSIDITITTPSTTSTTYTAFDVTLPFACFCTIKTPIARNGNWPYFTIASGNTNEADAYWVGGNSNSYVSATWYNQIGPQPAWLFCFITSPQNTVQINQTFTYITT